MCIRHLQSGVEYSLHKIVIAHTRHSLMFVLLIRKLNTGAEEIRKLPSSGRHAGRVNSRLASLSDRASSGQALHTPVIHHPSSRSQTHMYCTYRKMHTDAHLNSPVHCSHLVLHRTRTLWGDSQHVRNHSSRQKLFLCNRLSLLSPVKYKPFFRWNYLCVPGLTAVCVGVI